MNNGEIESKKVFKSKMVIFIIAVIAVLLALACIIMLKVKINNKPVIEYFGMKIPNNEETQNSTTNLQDVSSKNDLDKEKILGTWLLCGAIDFKDSKEIEVEFDVAFGSGSLYTDNRIILYEDNTYYRGIIGVTDEVKETKGKYTIEDNIIIFSEDEKYKYDSSKNQLVGLTEEKGYRAVYKKTKSIQETMEENKKDNNNSNSNFIALYNGLEFDNTSMSKQLITYMELSDENKARYNTTFYNYENKKYVGTSNGKFNETYEAYEGVAWVEGVKEVAFSKEFNALPRKQKLLSDLPDELLDIKDRYCDIDVVEVDLDGDNKLEYVVRATYDETLFRVTDQPYYAYSVVKVFDSKFNEIATLAEIENGFWFGDIRADNKVFIEREDINIIDVDDDGIMEIIVLLPIYEGGFEMSIVKYNKGKIIGEVNVKPNLVP